MSNIQEISIILEIFPPQNTPIIELHMKYVKLLENGPKMGFMGLEKFGP